MRHAFRKPLLEHRPLIKAGGVLVDPRLKSPLQNSLYLAFRSKVIRSTSPNVVTHCWVHEQFSKLILCKYTQFGNFLNCFSIAVLNITAHL